MKKAAEDPRIPPEYRKSGLRKIKTVGQLISHLQKLPEDLRMDAGFGRSLDVYVAKLIDSTKETFRCCIEPND
jgi:hypothetical protein